MGARGYSMFEALSASGTLVGRSCCLLHGSFFSATTLLQRLAGFVSGVAVLSVVASICGTEGSSRFDFDTSVVVSLSVIAVAGLLSPRTIAFTATEKVKRSRGVDRRVSIHPSFVIVSLYFGCHSSRHLDVFIRSSVVDSFGIGVLIMCIVIFGTIAMALLSMATLGISFPGFRLVGAIAFSTILGFFPPIYIGGPAWRFVTWPIVAFFTSLVVRSLYCGFESKVFALCS